MFRSIKQLLSAFVAMGLIVSGCGDDAGGGTPTPTPDGSVNTDSGTDSTVVPRNQSVFRFESLAVRAPVSSIEVNAVVTSSCDSNLFEEANADIGIPKALNLGIQESMTMDVDMDGMLDLNILTVFDNANPLEGQNVELVFGLCNGERDCMPDPAMPSQPTAYTVQDGNCVEVPAELASRVNHPGANGERCLVTDPGTVPFSITTASGSLAFDLHGAVAAAEYSGGTLTKGLLKGFLRKSEAETVVLEPNFNVTLNYAFPGGATEDITITGLGYIRACGTPDDLDEGPDGEPGWWFYMNFTAAQPNSYSAQ